MRSERVRVSAELESLSVCLLACVVSGGWFSREMLPPLVVQRSAAHARDLNLNVAPLQLYIQPFYIMPVASYSCTATLANN